MLQILEQAAAVTAMNIKSIPQRRGSSAVIVIGIAGVVAVLVAMLAMANGFKSQLASTGDATSVLFLRQGAETELSSNISREGALVIKSLPGIAKGPDGKVLASGELYTVADLPRRATGTDANVPVRGMEPEGIALRPQIKIQQGRMFTAGLNEVIVGKNASLEFRGLELGNEVKIRDAVWKVVGIFSADGSINESEILLDADVAINAFRRNGFQTVHAKLESVAALETIRTELKNRNDQRLSVIVQTEPAYYAKQSEIMSLLISGFGLVITLFMAVGASFGALNAMYAAVATRTRQIATLRALGFGALPVVIAVIVEALFLALIGGVIGGLLAFLVFNGYTASTLNFQTFSQVAFTFKVTLPIILLGVVLALLIGFVGGLLPAWRAARMPVTTALRAA
jgi:putative ABC transport system permease protein